MSEICMLNKGSMLFFYESKFLFSILTAGVFEQRQASQNLCHRHFSMDFVVSCAHIDTVSHLLLLSNHCQNMARYNSLTWLQQTALTNEHTATLTHHLSCASEI